ncbi:MAG: glycosyltransferase family 87 protein, partial [Deltaproteobacteria bacterium]
ALAVWLAALALISVMTWHADMASIYMGAHYFARGEFAMIYPPELTLVGETPQAWLPDLRAMGAADETAYPFVYPPIWAAVVAPLTFVLSASGFMKVTLVIQTGLLFGSVWLAYQIAGGFTTFARWSMASVIATLVSVVVSVALTLNQPQIMLTFFVLLAVKLLLDDRQLAAGALLGVVAAIKLAPVLFIVMLIATKRWRAALAMLASIAVLVALSFAICGPTLNADFIAKTRALADYTVSARLTYNIAPLLLSVVPQGPQVVDVIELGGYTAITPVWLRVLAPLLIAALTIGLLAATRNQSRETRIVALAVGLSLIIALAGPFGWAHYYLLATLMLPALLDPRFPTWSRWFFAFALVATSGQVSISAPLIIAQLLPFATFLGVLIFFAVRYDRASFRPLG